MNKFKAGDKVKILGGGSSVSSFHLNDGKRYYGAEIGDTRIVLGVVPHGGNATEEDPRYYGLGFNLRGHELELVQASETIINNYSIY